MCSDILYIQCTLKIRLDSSVRENIIYNVERAKMRKSNYKILLDAYARKILSMFLDRIFYDDDDGDAMHRR